MVDTLRLKGIIVASGFNQSVLAKKIGIAKNTLNLKINNESVFNADEIEALCEILNIQKAQDKIDIFLYKPSQK